MPERVQEEAASGLAPEEAAWALGSRAAALVAVAVTALVSVLAQVAEGMEGMSATRCGQCTRGNLVKTEAGEGRGRSKDQQ